MFRFLPILALVTLLALPAQAAFKGPGNEAPGGFKGPGTAVAATTVEAAANLPDNSIVTLTGNIVSHVTGSKDKYMFKDATGEIRIEISKKRFRGQDVTPENTVRITGEVDKDFGKSVEIDVKHLEVIK